MPRRRKDVAVLSSSLSSMSHLGHRSSTKEKPQQRNAANARERARMRVLSRAFCRLKTTLPWVPADTKLSKLDTLRLATTYIAHLRGVLVEGSSNESSPVPSHPLSMSWPFMFNNNKIGSTAADGPDGASDHSPGLSGSESPTSSDQYSFHDCQAQQLTNHLHGQHRPLPDSSQTVDMIHNYNHLHHHTAMYSSGPHALHHYNDHLMELQ